VHGRTPTAVAVVVLSAACLTGCGGGHAATAGAQATPATAVSSNGAPPRAGEGPAKGSSKPAGAAVATGRHDRVGELCSGRSNGVFAAEGLTCVTGRLERKQR